MIKLGALLALTLAAAACGGEGGGGEGTPGNVSASPASTGAGRGEHPKGKIAFVTFRDGDQEIYLMNTDGSDQRNLTKDPDDDFDPNLSPDGKRLAFASLRMGPAQVFVMNVDGTGLRQVTIGPGGLAPHWSNDGKSIVYSRGGAIAVVGADGSHDRVILEPEESPNAAPCRAGSIPGGWSPDDSEITYYAADIMRQEGQVCTVKADGSDVRVVAADPGVWDVEPVWSPDGQDIVYRAITNGVHDIWTVNLETGKRTNVTNDPEADVEPDWSADGQWIVFASLKPGKPNFDIYIVRRDGSDERRLTEVDAKDAYPSWAP